MDPLPITTSPSPLRILVVRNDKLGDFMLAWPALALLKKSLPDAIITVLVPAYTSELAAACPWVDQVLLDPQDLSQLTKAHIDIVLTLFSTGRIGWQVFKGRIPRRIAPATKWVQILYNQCLTQRRSRSEKPEYLYNLELAQFLLKNLGVNPQTVSAPYWPLPLHKRSEQRQLLATQLGLDVHQPWLFVHPGSGGSAVNISLDQFASLMKHVQKHYDAFNIPIQWVITAGPGEEAQAITLGEKLPAEVKAFNYVSHSGLLAFAHSLVAADVFIAGSTGPLHIAGALDVPTVGFFPTKRSATALRWRPCNSENRTLAFSPPEAAASDMSQINMLQAADTLVTWLRTYHLINN